MSCNIEKSTLSGSVPCPRNKSYTHRALFLASLAGRGSTVQNALLSEDTHATMQACRAMGAQLDVDGSIITANAEMGTASDVNIDAANSGTTIRIAAALAALFPGTAYLSGDSSLRKRPMQPLLDSLASMGATCSSTDGKPPLQVSGIMQGGRVAIPGDISSQFVSALMIAAPRTARGMEIGISGDLVSKPYLDITMATMRRFGVAVRTIMPYRSYVVPPQPYHPADFFVPMDFSSMAILLSASVLCGKDFAINGVMDELPQGDEAFLDILERLGITVTVSDDTIYATAPDALSGGSFDLGNNPDLLPPLAILALMPGKPINITNVGHARLKETDRIDILSRELPKLGVRVEERADGMLLGPPSRTQGAALDSGGDHRMFMVFCIAGMYVGQCVVTGAESVSVSYPRFIQDMVGAGARINMTQ